MSNRVLTADLIASEAVMILESNMVMANLIHRAEDEFSKSVNGFRCGDTINFKKPAQYSVRTGATAAPQDVQEGKVALTVDTQKGVDWSFTSKDLTLNIKDMSRVMKPALVRLAHEIDVDIMNMYKQIPAWRGTPASTIDSFADFSVGARFLDEQCVPQDDRHAVLNPADYWAMLSTQTALPGWAEAPKDAYRKGYLGNIGGFETYMSQNVPSHTTGSDVAGTINQAVVAGTVAYESVRDTDTQTITTASGVLPSEGDIFTIGALNAGVHDVHPVTKARYARLKQFRCVSSATNTLTFSPALIFDTDSPFQNGESVGQTDLNTLAITVVGSASTVYPQSLLFHRNAMAIALVPMEKPAGAVDVARKTYKGISVRVIPGYDIISDQSTWRLDVLYGVKAIDPRLACRLSGT
jgi:hypothetical protein